MGKSPIEIAIGQTNILIEDEVCKAVGKVGIHINKEELLTALKAYEFVEELINYIAEYPDDDYMTMECLCRKLVKHGLIDKKCGYYLVEKGIKVAEQTEPIPIMFYPQVDGITPSVIQTKPKCEECEHYGHKVKRCLLNKCKYE